MSQSSLHPSGKERVDQIQENYIAYFRLFADLPGIIFVEEDIIWIISKGSPGNVVLQTKLSNDATEQRIDEALSLFGRDCDHIDWFVFPSCQPKDLDKRLVAKGMAGGPDGRWSLYGNIGGPGGTWMLANLTSLSSSPSVPADFNTRRVSDHSMLEEWKQINAEGYGDSAPYKRHQIFYDAYARHGYGSDAIALHYIGYLGDRPVTSATLLLTGGIASVYNVSTPSCLRRRGFGSAITYAALQEAQSRGYQSAFIQSSPMGKGVYSKLGFVTTDFENRESKNLIQSGISKFIILYRL